MSEPQFSYSELTLDELRSMAASPQVGSMQAMPQSFHALADRVGEVADLLSHAQADLPNWWKGPAAEQAAATLGRAAAEAREFHDSARGAASTVSRCAQVVAEQQHQMINVPHVPEPGITDVVQRPTTPLEALNAARQDATYQAAHEQAVQVVNGIAAQYVETRSQLTEIGTFRAENFYSSPDTHPLVTEESKAPAEKSSNPMRLGTIGESQYQPTRNAKNIDRSAKTTNSVHSRDLASARTADHALSESAPRGAAGQLLSSTSGDFMNRGTHTDKIDDVALKEHPERGATPEAIHGASQAFPEATAGDLLAKEIVAPAINRHGYGSDDHRPSSDMSRRPPTRQPGLEEIGQPVTKISLNANDFGLRRTPSAFDTSHGITSHDGELAHSPLDPAHPLPPNLSNVDNAAIIPPYSGTSSAYRAREERSRRPTYLKERKSAWVPETIAVPADGVITPDWLEHR